MKVVVTGGRDYSNKEQVWRVLNLMLPSLTHVAHGACGLDADELWDNEKLHGADRWAHLWCAETPGVVAWPHPCHWRRGENGPDRNRRMLKAVKPDVVLAFPGAAGTESCVYRARRLGYLVLRLVP